MNPEDWKMIWKYKEEHPTMYYEILDFYNNDYKKLVDDIKKGLVHDMEIQSEGNTLERIKELQYLIDKSLDERNEEDFVKLSKEYTYLKWQTSLKL